MFPRDLIRPTVSCRLRCLPIVLVIELCGVVVCLLRLNEPIGTRHFSHATVENDNTKFHDPEANDPDWIIKQAWLLMLAVAMDNNVGADKSWRKGPSGGRQNLQTLVSACPRNWFLAFQAGTAMWLVAKTTLGLPTRTRSPGPHSLVCQTASMRLGNKQRPGDWK